MKRLILCASVLVFASCSNKTSAGGGGDCGGETCRAGEVCVDEVCVELCVSDNDCGDGEICVDDLCTEGQRDDLPLITGVAADGTPDTTDGHVEDHIASILTILGEHLDGVEVMLSDGSRDWDLEICSASASQVDVHMPTDITTGDYILTVANQAGTCNQTLPVLQGETGATGAAGAAGADGAPGVPCSGCVDTDTLDDDSVNGAKVIDDSLTGDDIDPTTTILAADFQRSTPVQRVLWLSPSNMAASKNDWAVMEFYQNIQDGTRMVFGQDMADTVLDSQFVQTYNAAAHGMFMFKSANGEDITATQEFVLDDGDRITGIDCYMFDYRSDSRVQAWLEKQGLTATGQPTTIGTAMHTGRETSLNTWQVKTQTLDETVAADTLYRLRLEINNNGDDDSELVGFRGCKLHYETYAL